MVEAVKNPELQITAASVGASATLRGLEDEAISGAVALGAGGGTPWFGLAYGSAGCAGLITGSVAGGACGLVPAIFTFGLSIPVGVAKPSRPVVHLNARGAGRWRRCSSWLCPASQRGESLEQRH